MTDAFVFFPTTPRSKLSADLAKDTSVMLATVSKLSVGDVFVRSADSLLRVFFADGRCVCHVCRQLAAASVFAKWGCIICVCSREQLSVSLFSLSSDDTYSNHVYDTV